MPTARRRMAMTDTNRALYRLLAWMSPSFPVGAYTYSHGLEYAVEAGAVHDRTTMGLWTEAIVRHGSGRVDAMLCAAAHRAAGSNDWPGLFDVCRRAAAHRGTSELATESADPGRAFLTTVAAAWGDPRVDRLDAMLRADAVPPAYATAVGGIAAWAGIAIDTTVAAFLHAFAANLISAGIRLIPLGQTDGQRLVAALETPVLEAARAAITAPPNSLGAATPIVDLAAMRHETQYTRLFRS